MNCNFHPHWCIVGIAYRDLNGFKPAFLANICYFWTWPWINMTWTLRHRFRLMCRSQLFIILSELELKNCKMLGGIRRCNNSRNNSVTVIHWTISWASYDCCSNWNFFGMYVLLLVQIYMYWWIFHLLKTSHQYLLLSRSYFPKFDICQ